MKKHEITRRKFIAGSAAAAGTFFIPARSLYGQELKGAASSQLRFAVIGVGGMGAGTRKGIENAGGVVAALCDVNRNITDTASKSYPGVPVFYDWRELLEKRGKDFDAVAISTPDHTHAIIALASMDCGKHCYVQKPLARTFEECEMLREKARKTGLVCQMGNQGHPGVMRYKALMDVGAWGEIEELFCWTDRPGVPEKPWWPQGMKEYPKPAPYSPGYDAARWDCWVGPCEDHGFNHAFVPFKWRGWTEYGCGAIGDMAVHNADPAFWCFGLGLPISVKGDTLGTGPSTVAYPKQSRITMKFAPQPLFPHGVTLNWSDGGILPEREYGMHPDVAYKGNGLVVRGSKLSTLGPSHAGTPTVIAVGKHEWNADSRDAQREANKVLREVKVHNHYEEWVAAIRDGKPEACGSNMDYAATLTEALLIGCVSLRFPGVELAFDPAKKEFTNCSEANAFLKAPSRGPWSLAAYMSKPWWQILKFW